MRYLSRVWFLLLPGALAGQTPASVQRAVHSITPDDIQRRIAVIADDSMRGRDTPSPELEEVAAYIAGEFRRFGLKPGGDDGTYLQRYRLDRVEVVLDSSALWTTGALEGRWRFGSDAVYYSSQPTEGEVSGPLLVLTGQISDGVALDSASIAGKIVILPGGQRQVGGVRRFSQWRPAAVVFVTTAPDSLWQRYAAQSAGPSLRDPVSEGLRLPPAVLVRDAAARPLFARAGLDPDSARQVRGKPLRAAAIPGVTAHLVVRQRVVDAQSAPNVIGILEGSDPRLKGEYLVYSAHMDHVGVGTPVNGDSIYNGADDDASGTIAVVEAAEAFALLSPRPRRSILFLTVSGEEHGLWGSGYFAEHPTVPASDIVADINLDMVGRNWKDSIAVIGREHSDLAATLSRVAAAHPELNMRPVDDLWPQENFYYRSDHYNFARKGVPILFFFNGTHPDYHRPSDSVDKIDAEKESRIVKLVFYLGLEVANAAERPKWNPDSYKRIVEAAN